MYTMNDWNQLLLEVKDGLTFAQRLPPAITYSVKNDGVPIAGSEKTVYRRLNVLESIGLANFRDGRFQINRAAHQPHFLFRKLLPSLVALKNARRFGKLYNSSDANLSHRILDEKFLITLDYAAWELTRYQTPLDLYLYVDDMETTVKLLKKNNFSEGKKGHIILLPKIGDFSNKIERVYLDCIARGGRNTMDAIAIEILHGDKLSTKGQFPIEYVLKVQEDLPKEQMMIEAAGS